MADGPVLERTLSGQALGGLRLLEALRWDSPLGPALRLWFGRGAQAGQLVPVGSSDVQLRAPMLVGPNLIVSGTATAAEGPLALPLPGGTLSVTPASPETELFAGLNVLCALRHREPPEAVAAWLAHHACHHGANAALIVDRGAPGPDRAAFAKAVGAVKGIRRLCVVTAPIPLGRPDRPALGDPVSAPRNSGAEARPDAWLSPLAEPVLFDILKWRFLARAGAVVALDVCDVLVASEIDAFTAARQSRDGVVPLTGEAIFPWRRRKQVPPGHGDHICRRDPPATLASRWAVDPARCGPESVWLPGNITGKQISEDGGLFQRCMSLIYADSPVQDLVARSRLVEDPQLVARSALFGAEPVRAPKPQGAVVRTTSVSDRTVIVTCMKNEGPFILEWLAHHRRIGVKDVLVFTNDCADFTVELLDLLQSYGLLQRRDNPFRDTGQRPQLAALAAAQAEPLVQNAGWILPIDVDEFVNIHVGEGRLTDLWDAAPGADLISMTWRLFGNSDRAGFEDVPVTEQFARCAPKLIRRPHQAWGFKTLYRNTGQFPDMGVHRPKGAPPGAPVRWVNGSGRAMPRGIVASGWRSGIDSYGYDLVTLNHYAVRNAESFLVKRDRGRVNHVTRDQGEGYWFRMNNNAEEDRSIQRHSAALARDIAELKADPLIAAAHAACVAAHRARIAELLRRPDQRAFYDLLVSDRMQRLSRLHRHLGMNVFLHGPSVVPDRLLEPDLPESFFFNTAPPEGPAAD